MYGWAECVEECTHSFARALHFYAAVFKCVRPVGWTGKLPNLLFHCKMQSDFFYCCFVISNVKSDDIAAHIHQITAPTKALRETIAGWYNVAKEFLILNQIKHNPDRWNNQMNTRCTHTKKNMSGIGNEIETFLHVKEGWEMEANQLGSCSSSSGGKNDLHSKFNRMFYGHGHCCRHRTATVATQPRSKALKKLYRNCSLEWAKMCEWVNEWVWGMSTRTLQLLTHSHTKCDILI